jgi:hypothetical protein
MPGESIMLALTANPTRLQAPGTLSKTYPCSKREFQIIRAEGLVINCGIQCLIEEVLVAEQVFGHTQPETEKLHDVNITTIWQYPLHDWIHTGVEQII